MNPGFLGSLEGGCLSVGQPGFGAALGENPALLVAGLNQQELNPVTANPEADRRHLLAGAQLAKMGQAKKLGRRLGGARPTDGQLQICRIDGVSTHDGRVHDGRWF